MHVLKSFRSLLVGLSLSVALSSCNWDSALGTIDANTSKAVRTIDDAIAALQSTSADWQQVLKDTVKKLEEDGQTAISVDVANVLSRTVAQAGVEFRCDADFIQTRVSEDLIALKAKILKQPAPERSPMLCQVVPEVVDRAVVPDHVKQLSYYGYNFDRSSGIRVSVVDDKGVSRDVTSHLDRPTAYAMTLAFGGNGVQLDDKSQRFVLTVNGEVLSTVGIVQPRTQPELCGSKPVAVFASDEVRTIGPYIPPKAGSGDDEFDGNGPDIHGGVVLSVTPLALVARVSMDAKETRPDWTEAQGWHDYVLYRPEPGWHIDHVDGVPLSSTIHYLDKTGSSHGPYVETRGPAELVERYEIVGDTPGADVGKTSITVRFNLFGVTLMQVGNCIPGTKIERALALNHLSAASLAALKDRAKQDADRRAANSAALRAALTRRR